MPHEKRVEIRWSDVDAYMHVNNAVYATYLEECRDEWVDRVARRCRRLLGLRARARRDRLPARAPPRGRGGRRQLRARADRQLDLTLREQIRTRDGELAAEAEAVLVARDRELGRSRPLTQVEREAFERAL